jgi:hypothetical protein
MPKIKHHQCHDCPSNTLMCKSHTHEFCHGFFVKRATTQMARQISLKWDGNFRFPRTHINGRSMETFSRDELEQMRTYYHAIWKEHWIKVQGIAKTERPDWPEAVQRAHEREIDIIREIRRRNELR